ncbi:MAG TPA: DUF1990 domain-containing protein [Catenuloplanes sp.]
MEHLSYPEVGATRDGTLPSGYRHLRYRTELRRGTFESAGEAVLSWRMHRALGTRITTDARLAAPGVRLTVGLGVGPVRLRAPCRVVWSVRDAHRAGFAYGTLPGHPARGEEAFLVERDADGRVWFTVTAFSVPARWSMRLAGPVGRLFQHAYARGLGAALRRLTR